MKIYRSTRQKSFSPITEKFDIKGFLDLAILRHIALNLRNMSAPPVSLRRKFDLAGWKDDFLAPHPRFDWATEIALKNR
jgi:hypothetical protein